MTHEVAYGGVLHERRRALHALVGAIETLHSDRLAEYAERLTHHALRGGEWDKAVRNGREAAMKAVGRSANQEATAYVQQALDALAHLPESRRTREMAIDLRLDLYVTLLPLDRLRPLLERLREAETLAEALEDRERLGWARLHICHVGGLLAEDLRPTADLARDVMAIAEDLGIQKMEADAYMWAGCGAYALGEHRRAVNLLLKGVDVRTVRQPGPPAREVRRTGGHHRHEGGELPRRESHSVRDLSLSPPSCRRYSIPWARRSACPPIACSHVEAKMKATRCLVTCFCGWERECSSEWAANSVSKLHPQLASLDVEHETRDEGPDDSEGQQLRLT